MENMIAVVERRPDVWQWEEVIKGRFLVRMSKWDAGDNTALDCVFTGAELTKAEALEAAADYSVAHRAKYGICVYPLL